MNKRNDEILERVASYYSGKLANNGVTAQGVDWNGEESQQLRFEQLCKLINVPRSQSISINDIGCGYGALWPYLNNRYMVASYMGVDVSADMIDAARRCYGENDNIKFIHSDQPTEISDYSIASGVFNVRLNVAPEDWWCYIKNTISVLNAYSSKGFSFNCLTSYSDPNKMRDYLYYADPCRVFDYCKRNFSRNVAVLHDYGLYEFTVIVRKDV